MFRDTKRSEITPKHFGVGSVLKAGNHEIIGSSEGYNSEAARDNGIASVKANAATAVVEDETA